MNFNIINGDDDYLQRVPEFVELYNANYLSVEKIIETMQIRRTTYRKLRKYCLEEGLINLRRKPNKKKENCKTNPKNYSHTLNRGHTYFTDYKNGVHYTSCKTEAQAKEIVRRLRACNWDKSKVEMIKEDVCQ